MRNGERTLAVVRDWVAKAENDLFAAAHLLKLGRQSPTDVICFHAQQCAEKYLKALLVFNGVDFPRTHDLDLLMRRLPNGLRSLFRMSELTELTPHATVSRYPGAGAVSLASARHAIASARRVRAAVRATLPMRKVSKPAITTD